MSAYDLRNEGEKVRVQLRGSISPVVEARNTMSSAILAHVLLGLSDAGFYEFVADRDGFSLDDACAALKVEEFVCRSLVEYLIGHGAIALDGGRPGRMLLTEKGKRYFNVYTRGVMNVYLGGYREVLGHLGDLLRGDRLLSDSSLKRSTRHAAAGTAYSTCAFTIPEVLSVMDRVGSRGCLDIGCGTGDFLIEFVRQGQGRKGVGVDMSREALVQARVNARTFAVDGRIEFIEAEVGRTRLEIPGSSRESVDTLTAMYMLHEFGRDGRQAIVDVLSALKNEFPGRTLLALEVEACDPVEIAKEDPRPPHLGRLDYRLIHQLSGQGLPLAREDWLGIFDDADCRIVEKGIPTGGSLIYLVRL